MYKFKTDIKQRFSAESSSGVESSAEYYTQDKKRRRKESSDCCATEDRPDEVPIFALHADGSYYIPLTINRDIISPMIDSVIGEDRSSVVVHPISISVNFQATANQFWTGLTGNRLTFRKKRAENTDTSPSRDYRLFFLNDRVRERECNSLNLYVHDVLGVWIILFLIQQFPISL